MIELMGASLKKINGNVEEYEPIEYNLEFKTKKEFDLFVSEERMRLKKKYNKQTEVSFTYRTKT